MQYPNQVQVALMFDQSFDRHDVVVRNFSDVMQAKTGLTANTIEAKPGVFHRLFGWNELMITFETVANPPNAALFEAALSSPFNNLVTPDLRDRLGRSQSLLIVNVSHGAIGDEVMAKFADLLASAGITREGATFPQFSQRLEALALAARITCDHRPPLAIHWTSNDLLLAPEPFETLAVAGLPGPLHIHPLLFGDGLGPSGQRLIGLETFGARHFIGQELRVEPTELPWQVHFETMLSFLRIALADKGYIIPDGDNFGPDDGSCLYKAIHHPPSAEGRVPVIELKPLMIRDHGFRSPDYLGDERIIDDRCPPPSVMPKDEEDRAALANEWREKRAMAEGLGGRFTVKAPGSAPLPPPVEPNRMLRQRVVFGRKKG